jgi:CHAT domain-containing protein
LRILLPRAGPWQHEAALRVRTPDQLPLDCQQTRINLASLYFQDREWGKALAQYEGAIDVTDQIRSAGLTEERRRQVWEQGWLALERAVLCANRANEYTLALLYTERSKTRNLAQELWRRDAKPRRARSEDWQKYRDYQVRIRVLEQQSGGDRGTGGGSSQERGGRGAAQVLAELGSLHEASRELEQRFAELDPDYAPLARPLEMPEIARLAKALEAVIVQFRFTSEGGFVFLTGPEDREVTREQVVELPAVTSDEVRKWLAEWQEGSDDPWVDPLEGVCENLYTRLFEPVHQRLRDRYPEVRRLVLIPNQALNLMPLHACSWRDAAGRRQYLCAEYEIVYAPSCQVLSRCLARAQAHGQQADTLFAAQDPDGSLPFSEWEVEEIAKLFPKSRQCVLAGEQASVDRVKTAMWFGGERHFSCHGRFHPADARHSHLKLADGPLAAGEVVEMDLPGTWLVVMSACETAMSDVSGMVDEYQGLPAAFLVAGAQTVLASLWRVDDLATALLMQRFHHNLYREGMPKAVALKEAQSWLRDATWEELDGLLRAKKEQLEASGAPAHLQEALTRAVARMAASDVEKSQKRLRFLRIEHGRPFSPPRFWAAFQCIGMGW